MFFWADSIIKQSTWEKAAAIVTKVAEDDSGNSNIQYSYFTFTDTERGKEYTVKSKMGASEIPIYELGSKVEVIYPVNNPAEAEENAGQIIKITGTVVDGAMANNIYNGNELVFNDGIGQVM